MIDLDGLGGFLDDPEALRITDPGNQGLAAAIPEPAPGLGQVPVVPEVDLSRVTGCQWPGGVCGAPSTAAAGLPKSIATPPQPGPLPPVPLVPDQPTPPGTPGPLAATEDQLNPLSQTPVSRVSGEHGPKDAPPSLSQTPVSGVCPPHMQRKNGLASPFKPQTPEQIAAFVRVWHDPTLTAPEIAKRYHVGRSALTRWSKEFGLMDRSEAIRSKTGIIGAMTEVAGVARAMLAAPATDGQLMPPGFDRAWDPMQDQDIALGFAELGKQALAMTAHSAIRPIRRGLLRLTLLLAARTPVRTYATATVTVETLASALLNVERVEGDLPVGGADPVQLRKESAALMMAELKSVMSPEEQSALARLIKAGAQRLMDRARAKSARPVEGQGQEGSA